jgi:hypothetical protein
MILHIVQFNLKPEIQVSDREWLFAQIKGLAKMPVVKRLAIGKLLDPREEWYQPRLTREYEWSLSIEFESEADLYTYQKHPVHETVAAEIRNRVSGSPRIVDFVSQ